MPTGGPSCLSYMCSLLLNNKPRSVLDIGIGHGKWGFLVREFVDLWIPENKYGEVDQQFFDSSDRFNSGRFYGEDRTRLVGIEIFEPYITDIQHMIYDEILIGDVHDILPSMEEHFDIIICADVLEHLERNQGIDLLNDFHKHGTITYVLVPINCGSSGRAEHGNVYEIHKTSWTSEELRVFGTCCIVGDIYNLLEIKGEEHD